MDRTWQHAQGGGVPGWAAVRGPRRPSDAGIAPEHTLARKLLPRGAGSVFSFDIKGNREQGKKFIETLKVFSHLANVGDCRSLVIHPASTTHFRMSDEAMAAGGITQGTIRLSIGLEDPDDLIDDLKRALKAAEKAS
jgi:O-acetylhomoserine (thiol)-lyase